MSVPATLADELTQLSLTRATHFTAVSAVAALVYDYFLCLPDEVRYIWTAPWNLGKMLYLLSRYIPTVDMIIHLNTFVNPRASVHFVWFYIDVFVSWISLAVLESLLVVRTLALYSRSRRIISPLLVLLTLANLTAVLGIIIVVCVRVQTINAPSYMRSLVEGCWYEEATGFLSGVWFCPLIFDAVIFILTLNKAVEHVRTKTLQHSPLFIALYADGFIYFLVIFVIAIANILVWYLVPLALGQLLVMPYRLAMCVMGSRIILNLRKERGRLATQSPTDRGVDLNKGWNTCAEVEISHVSQVLELAWGATSDGQNPPESENVHIGMTLIASPEQSDCPDVMIDGG